MTTEGVIVVDPINAETASWLKAELQRRFAKTVKYLIYSHHHADHISGGEIFADAVVIAHENAVASIVADAVPTKSPDLTFSDHMQIRLGGKIIELSYAGLSHTDNMINVHFPAERAVYAVDFVLAKALPYRDIPGWAYFYPEWLDALVKLEKMDFDILLPAHDKIGTHKDVRGFRRYIEDLEDEVSDAISKGLSIDEIQDTILLERYSDWDKYDEWRALNVKGMYHQLLNQRAAVKQHK